MKNNLLVTIASKWLLNVTLSVTMVFMLGSRLAQANGVVASGSGNTSVYNAPNGVPVVNINTPNTAGLSANQYTDFNVHAEGLVLNNLNPSTIAAQSQLAGSLGANLNLQSGKSATVILNEVISTNRSQLRGYTEVFGAKADVIIANPYGITLDGAGFINTDNVVLGTGIPTITNNQFTGFIVESGDILISGNGINADAQQTLNIVARAVRLDGPINTTDLVISTGGQTWNQSTRTSTEKATAETAPTYALDSTAIGGMYAGRIRLIANEAGVGVRLNGEAAATTDDFTIDSKGIVVMNNTISAERDLKITTTTAADLTFSEENANYSAKNDIVLNIAGATSMNNASFNAGNDLSLTTESLDDTSTNNANRFATNNTVITSNSSTTLSGSTWGAGNNLTISSGSNIAISGTGSAKIYSGSEASSAEKNLVITSATGNITISDVSIESSNNLEINSNQGEVNLTATNNSGIVASNDVTIKARTQLSNLTQASTIKAGNNTSFIANDAGTNLTVLNAGAVEAGNDIQLQGSLDLINDVNAVMVAGNEFNTTINNLTNRATISAASFNITADDIINDARMDASTGSTISANSLLNSNSNAVLLLAKDNNNLNSTITLTGNLDNYGVLHGNSNVTVSAENIYNRNTAGLSSTKNITASAANLFDNFGAIFSPSDLSLTANTMTNRGTINSSDTISITAANFTNNSDIISAGDINITTSNSFNNETLTTSGSPPAVQSSSAIETNNRSTQVDREEWYVLFALTASETLRFNETDFYTTETLANGASIPATKAQIIANGASSILSLDYGAGSAQNNIAILSANTININGTGTFTNKDLTTYRRNYTSGFIELVNWDLIAGTDYRYWGATTPGPSYSTSIQGPDIYNYNPGAGWVSAGSNQGAAKSQSMAAGAVLNSASVLTTTGSGIFAGSFNFTNGTFVNEGSPASSNTNQAVQGAGISVAVSGTSVSNPSDISIAGINLSLPTNPNGYFVISQSNNSQYLIETNPLFGVDSNFVGSNYIQERYGVNPDEVVQRLGDANYEAQLIRQQLIAKTGRNVINVGESESAQMQRLMDNAINTGLNNNFEYGKSLTPEQVANLTHDIVWMEETVVAGQTVLAPVVYLAQKTIEMINGGTGAMVIANDSSFKGKSLKNIGGTIATKETLTVDVEGDIENISGNISADDISLKSAKGSIINETLAETQGKTGSSIQRTVIGKKATISARNGLELDANKDIIVKGADISSGGDASLRAGGTLKVTTIVDKSSGFEESEGTSVSINDKGGLSFTTRQKDRVSEEKNIGSSLDFGGELNVNTGKKTIIEGSSVSVGDDAKINAKGGIDIIAVQDKRSISSQQKQTTIGGDSWFGSSTSSSTTNTVTNQGSNVNFNKNLELNSEGKTVIKGSNLAVKNDAVINSRDGVEIISVQDQRTEQSSFSSSSFGGDSLYSESTTKTNSFKGSNKASNVDFGNSANINTDGEFTLQGSNMNIGEGNSAINAKKGINVLDGLDEERSTVTKTSLSVFGSSSSSSSSGSSAESSAGVDEPSTKTDASAETGNAQASANASAGVSASAQASAEASAGAGVNVFTRVSETTSIDRKTSVASTLFSKGSLRLNSKEGDLNVVGSDVETEDNLDINAKNINILAGRNEETINITRKTESFDISVSSDASAEAGAEASSSAEANASAGADINASKQNPNVNLSAEASAEAGVSASAAASAEANSGLQAGLTQTTETSEEYNLKNRGSTLKSGGNMTLNAKGDTTLQGAEVEVGGDFKNTGKNLKYLASEDVSSKVTTKETTYTGIYVDLNLNAEASAEANASAGAGASSEAGLNKENISEPLTAEAEAGVKAKAGANASAEAEASAEAGIQVTVTQETSEERSTQNNVSKIKVKGNMTRTAENKITDEGLDLEVGGDFEQEAKTIEMKAVKDTNYSKTTKTMVDTTIGVKAVADASAEAGASASVEGSTGDGSSSKTKTKADAGAGARVGGRVNIKVSNSGEESSSSTAVTGNYKIGGNLKSKSANSTTVEGANIDVSGDAEIEAESFSYEVAKSTSSESSYDTNVEVEVEVTAGVGSNALAAEAEVGVGVANESANSSTSETGAFSANNIRIITKKDMNFEGTDIEVENDATLKSGGDINFTAARDTSQSSASSVDVEVSFETDGDEFEANASVDVNTSSSSSSEAITGGIRSKSGNINLKSTGDTNLEGTDLDAKNNINIEADSLNYKAANSTDKSNEVSVSVGVKITGEDGGADVGVGIGSTNNQTAKTGSMGATNINIKTKNNTNFEGTDIDADKNVNIDAGGGVDFKAARNIIDESSLNIEVGVGTSEKSNTLEVGVDIETNKTNEAVTGGISGTNINIKSGKKVTLESTEIDASANRSIQAKEGVVEKEAINTDDSFSIGIGISLEQEKEATEKEETPQAETKDSDPAATNAQSIQEGASESEKNKS